ncbi:MAG: sigma-70 family RNA polymerase sigma factor [Clostridia bacterium]|nr:sigma-70 family RNA polymerase sigma factor [Clostridia bacterium]
MNQNSKKEKSEMTDEQIIALYWQRSEEAISQTDRKYGAFLFRIAYNMLHDREDCEECRNDTYLGAWNAIPPTRPDALGAFLVQIMRRIAINRYKQKTSKKHIPAELTLALDDAQNTLHSEESVEAAYEAAEVGKVINDYVKALPDRTRYIFIDRFYLSESVQSIAADLKISPATVYREIEKIKQELRSHLERNDIII